MSVKNSLLLLCNDGNEGANGIVSSFVISEIDSILCDEKYLGIFWYKTRAKATQDEPTTIDYFSVFLNEKRGCLERQQLTEEKCPLIRKYDFMLYK